MGYHLNADESPMNFSIALSANPFPLEREHSIWPASPYQTLNGYPI